MPSRKTPKYFIGEQGFTTKQKCLTYTRDIIKQIGYRKIYNDDIHFKFLCDLLENHTEKEMKIGSGIDYFELQPHHIFKKPYLLLHRTDNTIIDISYIHCCEFKQRSALQNLNDAMRYAVKNTTIEYKLNLLPSVLKCAICKNSSLDYKEYHVDHIYPFSKLQQDFIFSHPSLDVPTIFDDSVHDIASFRKEDKQFENEWVDYHDLYANLQILCSKCNLIKGKK
jgi:5-methylcytosine-specific restriction endonuclease McrA